jgi:ATP-dependent DNA helicase RecQ
LAYVVRRPADKEGQLVEVLNGVKGSAIVYVRSRGLTKEIAYRLGRRGISAAAYHAGLEPEEKDSRQAAWIAGKLRVMVATNAFGMGIDKADVRTVVHYGPPDSPEAYFQEAGRGGRDGQMSYGVMLYHASDGERLLRQWTQSYPEVEEIRRMYRALGSYLRLAVGGGKGETYTFDLAAFSKNFGFEVRQAFSGLKALERAGYILLTEDLHQRATLQIIVTKEELYAYRIRNAWAEKIIKSILRTSQGAFVNPVQLREGALANFLQISLEVLQSSLRRMQGDGIVDYVPERDGPQLVFLEERIDPDNLRIDVRQYTFLKERAHHRIETMIGYGSQDAVCRSRLLLNYFGEQDAPVCGICDVCRKNRGSLPTAPEVLERLRKLAGGGPVDLAIATRLFGSVHREAIGALLQELANEGEVILEGEEVRLP